jgi:ferredoxin
MSEEKKITVDPAACIGCGLCVSTCPDVFALGDDGKSFVKSSEACAACNCQSAIDDCPAHAISWVE